MDLSSQPDGMKYLIVVGVVLVTYFLVRRIVLPIFQRIAHRTKVTWDDVLADPGLLRRLSWVLPPITAWVTIPLLGFEGTTIDRITTALLIISAMVALSAILRAANEYYLLYAPTSDRPIKGYLQVVMIIGLIFGAILTIATLSGAELGGVLTGLGAVTAVLILVFQSTILSIVASLQLAGNDMVRLGDWIEVPGTRVDGDVIDVALHTVKVQNWDKTIATIPTHDLVTSSFVNWRGMSESGGRRIKRSLTIDQTSVRFLSTEEIDRWMAFEPIAEYMEVKRDELAGQTPAADGLEGDPRRLTNLGTFRAYAEAYLRRRSDLQQDQFTKMVRQLPPGPDGVAIELYVFTATTDWVEYEGIQADIFDHLLAMLPEFDLTLFQHPTGTDVRAAGSLGR
ncbi:MAG: mechanosensitive ion channel family protein [Acidimicrobiia bacterium]|nr:mechanosensitive ion channel family protein [Acidimicrobiia bacterium]